MDVAAALALAGEGNSRRKIARLLGVSRNTLRKYLAEGAPQPPGGKLAGYLDAVSGHLALHPRSRAMDVYRKLQTEGYAGSYDLVKRKVRSLRKHGGGPTPEPQPGRRAVADLGRVETAIGPCWLFTLALEYSGRIYAELSPRADLEAFLDWHLRAFRYFGGVPREIAYEKARNRLLKAFVGAAETHLPISRFAVHYGFVPRASEPQPPWSGGRLKRPIRMIETLFLRGYPFQTAEGANPAMLGWLLSRENDGDDGRDRFASEQAALQPLPKAGFAPFRLKLLEKGPGPSGSAVPDRPVRES